MTMRVPPAVSSRKQDWPYQVSLPAGAARARVRRQSQDDRAQRAAARSRGGGAWGAMIAPRGAVWFSGDVGKRAARCAARRRAATAEPARGRGGASAQDAGRDPGWAPDRAGRLHHEGRAREGDLHRQGGGAAQPRPPVLPAEHRRQPRLRAAAGGHRRRHRNRHHVEREGSAAAREHADQAPPAALQRQPQGRQELPGAAAGPEGGVAAPGGGAAARRRRRALLRPVPLGDVVPRGAAGGEPPLPAADLHRSRAAQPAASLPAVPDQALPGALRAAGGARAVRRSGPRRAAVPRRQERRAARPAVRRA